MRLIFSRNRAAQLDLLLRSLTHFAGIEDTVVIYRAGRGFGGPKDYETGYGIIAHPDWIALEREDDFTADLHDAFERRSPGDDTVTFFCDDDVVFRPLPSDPRAALVNENVLCHSWRLGFAVSEVEWAAHAVGAWAWARLPRTDHGYPGSIDGHTFRTADVLRMIDGQQIDNPTMLETILAHRCEMLAEERPLMSAWPEQVLVSVPVNRVSVQSGCDYGLVHPQTTEELNARWLTGERIALDELDFSGVAGCHHEVQFEWEPR